MLDDGEPKWAKLMIMSSSVRAFTTRELRDMHAHFKVAGVTSLRPVCLRICDVCDVRCAPPSTVSTQVGLFLYSRARHKMMHCATTITPAAGAAGSPVHSFVQYEAFGGIDSMNEVSNGRQPLDCAR